MYSIVTDTEVDGSIPRATTLVRVHRIEVTLPKASGTNR
ncbi:hypothetical protein MYBA111488_16045 [Mycobacterium basiliense]